MGKLEKKVALITGGGSGIGKATAKKFADEGALVVVQDFNEASAEEVQQLPLPHVHERGGLLLGRVHQVCLQ